MLQQVFINGYMFYIEEYIHKVERHIIVGCVLRDQLLMSLKLTTKES